MTSYGNLSCMAIKAAVVNDSGEWVPDIGFGDRLRAIRRAKHRGQQEMADLLGVKKVTYSSWEAGIATPPYAEIVKLARQLYLLDRVPQWWTLGADQPPANVWGAPSARSSTDRASDYGSGFGRFSPFRVAPGRPHRERRNSRHVVPLTLVS